MRHFSIAAIAATYAITFTQLASAADLPVKAAPAPVAAPYTWTGFYIGANGGYGGWKDPTVTFTGNDFLSTGLTCGGALGGTCVPPASFGIGGFLGGVQAGYNWQIHQKWLLGVEADFNWSNIKGTGSANVLLPGFPALNFQASENIKWFGTVRGRVGFLPTNSLLVYATGGIAYGRVTENAALNHGSPGFAGGGFALACNVAGGAGATNCLVGNSSRTATGYTAGAGAEYVLWRNLTLKAEYLYVNLGHANVFNISQAPTVFGASTSFTAAYSKVAFNVVRGGLNWKF